MELERKELECCGMSLIAVEISAGKTEDSALACQACQPARVLEYHRKSDDLQILL